MSRNLVERVLYQLCVDRGAKQRFREAPDDVLSRYALTGQERAMVLAFDVKALQAYGINPMLTMGYWQELAPQRDMRSYMKQLRDVDNGGTVFSAAIKG